MRLSTSLLVLLTIAYSATGETPKLTLGEQEEFLRTAKVIKTQPTKGGITQSIRATLSDGRVTHDAHIQTIDEAKTHFEGTRGTEMNFRDTYKFNIAGYRLGKMLGLSMIPPSIERSHGGKAAAFTWWVDDVLMDEAARMKKKIQAPNSEDWNEQMHMVRVFDQLIHNTDRNLGNLLITNSWKIWMIDHTRAFRIAHSLLEKKNLSKCDEDLLAALKKLNAEDLRKEMGTYLRKTEIEGLLKRRDVIVAYFDGSNKLYRASRRD